MRWSPSGPLSQLSPGSTLMARQPSPSPTPAPTPSSNLAATAPFVRTVSPGPNSMNHSPMSGQQPYIMPSSPAAARRSSADDRPSIKKAQGHVPACLVNASVTYVGNDQIYAFGGFDQYTDEGLLESNRTQLGFRTNILWNSVQPRSKAESTDPSLGISR